MRAAEIFTENEVLTFPKESDREELEKNRLEHEKNLRGMVHCPICKGAAILETRGRLTRQPVVYAGCFESGECSSRSVIGEGWSEAEAAAEWNRKNGGWKGRLASLAHWLRNWKERRRAEKFYKLIYDEISKGRIGGGEEAEATKGSEV